MTQIIHPFDIPFSRKPVTCYSVKNLIPYQRLVTVGMPQFGEYKSILDSVFFLYPTIEDATEGKKFGGTGFLVAFPSVRFPGRFYHRYAVTNWHAACRDSCSIIRLNTASGNTDIIPLNPTDWHFIPGRNDIAVTPMSPNLAQHKVKFLSPDFLMSDDEEKQLDIGVGDDVFMIGRFVDFDGVQTNQPAARFGNISIASAGVKQPTGFAGRSIVVDMHSRTGFSGSPVFVYRTSGSIFAPQSDKGLVWTGGHTLKLLGIHWGQFPEVWEISRGDIEEASLITDGQYVKGLSGMTCVCPSSAILEILNLPALVALREETEAQLERFQAPVTREAQAE